MQGNFSSTVQSWNFTQPGQLKTQKSLSFKSEKMFSFNNFKKNFWITGVSIIRLKFQVEENKANIYYLEKVDMDYPDNFKTLKNIPYQQLNSSKSAVPCKSFWFGSLVFFRWNNSVK